MKCIVIKQTVEYTNGLFRGQTLERFIRCYTEKEKLRYMKETYQFGSPVKLIKVEVLK